eukprot:GILJ01023486.1.p2 GENE.GILJ01023486.1~~GILJ01023486.1.p2  ORF type:complete len:274 (-),score=51.41 GILJ01023486.1:1334-2062(-)
MATAAEENDQVDDAIESLRRLLGVVSKKDKEGELHVLLKLCRLSASRNYFVEAFQWHEQALTMLKEHKNEYHECQILQSIALVYFKMQEYGVCVDRFEKALQLAKQTSDARSEAAILTNMAIALEGLAEDQAAMEVQLAALGKWRAIQDVREESRSLTHLGQLCINRRDFLNAKQYFLRAKVLLEEWPRHGNLSEVAEKQKMQTAENESVRWKQDMSRKLQTLHSEQRSLQIDACSVRVQVR